MKVKGGEGVGGGGGGEKEPMEEWVWCRIATRPLKYRMTLIKKQILRRHFTFIGKY